MIKPPLVMNRSLAEHGDGQGPLECLLKESFDLTRLRKQPRSGSIIANKGSCSQQFSLRHPAKFRDFLLALDFDQGLRDVGVSGSNLLLRAADFEIHFGQRAFTLFDFAL